MLKLPLNPIAIELIKSCTDRSTALDKITPLVTLEGVKLCAWCHLEKARGPKYCGEDCRISARAHFYPQKEESLNFLLMRQNFQCAHCQYDWKPLIEQLLVNGRVYDKPNDYKVQFSYWLMRRIKSKSPKLQKPEVDHRIPIYKGGSPLGLDNVDCLCYTCHKIKTKIDLSGKRSKKS
jgi:hypothetical protein